MTDTDWIESLIARDELWRFYKSPEWMRLKTQILMAGHYECRICKEKGIVRRYERGPDGRMRKISTVHHVKEVRKHPELAMERYYFDQDGQRHDNLIPVCKACHNDLHNRSFEGSVRKGNKFITPERW